MTNLRLVSANLINQISDKISQDLGYRPYQVFIPGFDWIEPRPKVTDATGKYFSDATYARWLGVLDALPNKVYQIRIPKMLSGTHVTEDSLRTRSNWQMRNESGDLLNVKPLDIESRNSYYLVTVAVLKGKA